MNDLEMCAKDMFSQLWANYVSAVLDAQKIEESLRNKNDVWNLKGNKYNLYLILFDFCLLVH